VISIMLKASIIFWFYKPTLPMDCEQWSSAAFLTSIC
jgi:hypothetical protein